MGDLLNFFRLDDAVPIVLLVCLLEFVGARIAGDIDPAPRWWARGVAAAAFLGYAACGIAEWGPTTPQEFLSIGLRAVLAMGTAHGVALVTLPVARFLYLHLWVKPRERRHAAALDAARERARRAEAERREREAADRAREERERAAAEERRRREELANRPAPPTRQQRMAAARAGYESTLREIERAGLDDTELRAAREQAKQAYLRELDEAMRGGGS